MKEQFRGHPRSNDAPPPRPPTILASIPVCPLRQRCTTGARCRDHRPAVCRTFANQPTAVQSSAVHHSLELVQVVRVVTTLTTLGQSGQDAREATGSGGVKSVVGLIEQQDVRFRAWQRPT